MRTSTSVGVAIDDARLTIVWRDAGHTNAPWRSTSAACDGTPVSVTAALDALAHQAPSLTHASVTLCRPLAQTRTIRLPRMARATLENVLARDWSRHIIGQRATPHTVGARQGDADTWHASFAPTDLLETFGTEGRTADDALASALPVLVPEDARSAACFVVVCDASGATDVLCVRSGLPSLGRRFPAGATAVDVVAFTHAAARVKPAGTSIVLLGHATHTTPLARALGEQGMRARAIDLGLLPDAGAGAIIAVAGTHAPALLPLRTPGARNTQARQMRTTTRWLALAAATALIAAPGLERWRVGRALDDVRRARADISAQVSNAIAARAEVDGAADVVGALAEREANASRVSGVLAAITVALPAGASLTGMQVAGDSVTIEGESSRSATVYEALRGVPALEQVKLAAPLRQERQAGDIAVERFAFSARLRKAAR